MDAYFDNKTNILNAHIRTTYDDSILYKVKSTTSFRGPRITVLEDANPVPGYTGSNIVGAIHWKDKLLEVHGHRRPLADIKRREGRMFHLNSSKHWRWGNEHREYQVRFEDDEWKVTVDHGMSIAARFEVPLRPHLFTKAKPPVIHLTRTALEADEVFMILVLIYSESRRQDRTSRAPSQLTISIQRFIEYVNDIFDRTPRNMSMALSRNDPTLWWGINDDCRLNAVRVTPASLRVEGRGSFDKENSQKRPFHPYEAVCLWEFKSVLTDLLALFKESTKSKQDEPKQPKGKSSTPVAGKKRAAPPQPENRAKKCLHPSGFYNIASAPPCTSAPNLTETPGSQCAGYALEMLSYGLCQHVISFFIEDSTIRVLYYDRSIFLRSKPLDVILNWHASEYTLEHIATFSLLRDRMEGLLGNGLREPASCRPKSVQDARGFTPSLWNTCTRSDHPSNARPSRSWYPRRD
ncbi:hypothetical protein ONZ45_g19557 [Pleurotus djamor]|nr:hypothetical protein ONZ45_g19557 [Pleurotus djamor]